MKVAVGLRRVAAGKRTSGRRAAQIALYIPLCFLLIVTSETKRGSSFVFTFHYVFY